MPHQARRDHPRHLRLAGQDEPRIDRPRPRDPLAGLTDRQHEVLALMAEGRSNAAIAARLHLTEKAVVRHASHVYDQLGIEDSKEDHRRVLAVVRYLSRWSATA